MSDMRGDQEFHTTQWSLVVSSRGADSSIRRKSLGELYESYWYPLFAYLRRKGHLPDDAADYVQAFFAELIDKEFLDTVSPDKGRFRWFLMSAVKRFVSKQLEKQQALKRGGGQEIFSIDRGDAEKRYQLEPVDGWTAEKLFDRRWALAVLQQALAELKLSFADRGKSQLFAELQPTLGGVRISQQRYEEIAERLKMTPGAVKVAALRLREKYRQTMQEIVQQTMVDSEAVDDELDELLSALRG